VFRQSPDAFAGLRIDLCRGMIRLVEMLYERVRLRFEAMGKGLRMTATARVSLADAGRNRDRGA